MSHERAAVTPRGEKEHSQILHRAGENDASENPQRARQVAHLGGEHRSDQGNGASNCRESGEPNST